MKSITCYTLKEADIKPGDTVVVLCDKKKGMAIVKSEVLEDTMDKIMPDGK